MIVKCLCEHEDQDRFYGKGNRVANQTTNPEKVRCTVCRSEINVKTQTVTSIKEGAKNKK